MPSSELARDTLELLISDIVLAVSPQDVPDLDVGKVSMHTQTHTRPVYVPFRQVLLYLRAAY